MANENKKWTYAAEALDFVREKERLGQTDDPLYAEALAVVNDNKGTREAYEAYRKEVEKHIKIVGHAPTDVMTEDEAAPALDFHKTCGAICIVNHKTNHVISFSGVGEDEASKLQNLLDYLKTYDW